MRFTKILKPERIRTDMETEPLPAEERETMDREEILERNRKEILKELVELLEGAPEVSNESKLYDDLLNREKRASTALGNQVALPHVRTMQARDMIMSIGRSEHGFEFDAPDGEPVRLFICIVAPPYDDSTYLKIYERLGDMLQDDQLVGDLLSAEAPGVILRELNRYQ